MRLFIAEKPEIAKGIAEVLGRDFKKSNGYIEVGDNLITWAFGHILELYEPHEYNPEYKKWSFNNLPFDIDEFKYRPIPDKKNQLKIIKELIKRKDVTELVNAGDGDEEGQILIDEILAYCSNTKPVQRVLINSLAKKDIKKALENIKPNEEFKTFAEKGFARSQADWWVGMNLTRAYTLSAQKTGFQGVLSVGRVQTPILALVVNRDREHENFKNSVYYAVSGLFKAGEMEFTAQPVIDGRIEQAELAENIKNKCTGKPGQILDVKNEEIAEEPPLPYNLLELQATASRLYDYKPDEVLTITQELREKFKLITYNRSDSQYLPESMFEEAPEVLHAIQNQLPEALKTGIAKADTQIKSRAFNDKNVTAHHGIIPTATSINREQLNTKQKNIYDLIARNYILQFYPAKKVIKSSLLLEIESIQFKANSRLVLDNPFDFLLTKKSDNDEKEAEDLNLNDFRSLKTNDSVQCTNITVTPKKTKPKPYYKMSTLLEDLKAVAKYVKDERIKKLLLDKDKGKKGERGGIGTPATRSEHIKKLFERGFIKEDSKKNVISTEKGREIINTLPAFITSLDMTALWYEQQEMIGQGKLTREQFLEQIKKQVANQVEKSKIMNFNKLAPKGSNIPCPVCKTGNLRRYESKKKKGLFWWGCSNYQSGCKATFFDSKGKPSQQIIQKEQK